MKAVKDILQTPLFRATSLNSVSVAVRIMGGLLASKMIAIFIGPSGMALVGNLRNFLTSLDYFSILGFQNGIIRYTAENEKDAEKLYRTLATVIITIFGAILIISAVLFFVSHQWGEWVFGSGRYSWIFRLLAFSMPWYAGNLVFMAVLNGLGRYRQVIAINIWGNVIGVVLSALLIWKLGVTGAFLGLIINPALTFIFSFWLVYRSFGGFQFLQWRYFDPTILRGLFSYSLMSLVSAILAPVVFISIRNHIIADYGEAEAGLWEGINRISAFYLMFVSTLLTVYFLPRLATASNGKETNMVFKSYFTGIVPIFAVGLAAIYLLREWIIRLILSEEFLPMERLFFYQMLGDLLKVCSLILGYQLIARKQTKLFIVTEIGSFAILYASSHFLIGKFGAEGAVMAHAFTYTIYLGTLLVYLRKILF